MRDLNGYTLNDYQRTKYENLEREHLEKAVSCYNQAQERCLWLPSLSDREKANSCFYAALTTLAPNNPMSKVIVTIISLAGSYGLAVINEWHEINTLLYQSKYHYEMQEFYTDVLKNYR